MGNVNLSVSQSTNLVMWNTYLKTLDYNTPYPEENYCAFVPK